MLPPDVNESARDFTVVDEGIRFGLAGVKNVGEGAIEAILEARARARAASRASSTSRQRVDARRVNRRVVESLVKCGAFDSLHPNRAAVWAALDAALERGAAAQRDREIGQGSLFGGGSARAPARARAARVAAVDRRERLGYEKEVLGFYVTGHPLGAVARRSCARFADTTLDARPRARTGREVRVGRARSPALRETRTRKGDRDGLRHARGPRGQPSTW